MLVSAVYACACAQQIEFAKERKATVKRYRFVGNHREESMWSALYGAKSGKIYIGLCTHAEAAHFYEFDPATETMRHIIDLTKLHGERGEGINTNGKIHVRMGDLKPSANCLRIPSSSSSMIRISEASASTKSSC